MVGQLIADRYELKDAVLDEALDVWEEALAAVLR